MIRNEVDVVRLNILYHSKLGIDRRLIVDNGSTDGTDRVLKELSSRDPQVRWIRDEGPYRQTEIHTELAREAYREGADWVVQIDADEFWHVPEGAFRSLLARSKAAVLCAPVLHFAHPRYQKHAEHATLID